MERDLTPDGELLFKNIERLFEQKEHDFKILQPKIVEQHKHTIALSAMKMELVKMIENSKRVIEDCTAIEDTFESAEEYLLSDTKTAKFIHTNLITRLERILLGMTAFEDESHLHLNTLPYKNYLRV